MPKKMPWEIPSRVLQLTYLGHQKIEECKEKPARRVGGGRSNVCYRFPSQKMGIVIQAESRMLELPCILALEKDRYILEYYDQPFTIKVTYQGEDGRKRSHLETPDYYAHTRDSRHCIIECKPLKVLEEKGTRCPTRYCKDAEGRWISPAGIEAAASLGCEYLLFTEDHVSIPLARNIKFLLNYMLPEADEALISRVPEIQKQVKERGSVLLKDLIRVTGDADAIYYAILHEKVVFPIDEDLLCYPDLAWVHVDRAHADLHYEIKRSPHLTWKPSPCRIGDVYRWVQTDWRVTDMDRQKVGLINEVGDAINLKTERLRQLIINNDLRLVERSDISDNPLGNLSDRDIDETLRRLGWVKWCLDKSHANPKPERNIPSERTLRRWVARYRLAIESQGHGVLGLQSDIVKRGNRKPRLDARMEVLLEESIKLDYNNNIAPSMLNAYQQYKKRASQNGLLPVCYETYRKRIKSKDRKEATAARFGWKAAYQLDHPVGTDVGAPVHGDRPWEVSHIDHTKLDVVVVSKITGEVLGRPWMTLLVDASSGMPLAFSLSLENPSYRSLMRVIRDCVRRHERLPDCIFSDQGAEFMGLYYEKLLARYWIQKGERAASHARQGTPVEGLFGKLTKSYIHSLSGNTKANKHGRAQSHKTHSPELHASMTLDELGEGLDHYLFEVYANQICKGTKESPSDRMCRLLEFSGAREFKNIKYDEDFIYRTFPEAEPSPRMIRVGRSVVVNHLAYFGEILRKPEIDRMSARVRYDPYDISYVWLEIGGQKHRLSTTSKLYREYAERGILYARDEISVRGASSSREIRKRRISTEDRWESKGNVEDAEVNQESALKGECERDDASVLDEVIDVIGKITWKPFEISNTYYEDN